MRFALFLSAALVSGAALAHDMAAWSDPARDAWYRSLRVPEKAGRTSISCCDLHDAAQVPQDHVKQIGTTWYVFIEEEGGWVEVPADRVVTSPPSIDGEAYLFMMYSPIPDSPHRIRCFVPPVGMY